MKIEFNEGQVKSIVSEAILQSLDQEKRDALIKDALAHLLTPEHRSAYGGGMSPIQSAFRQAVGDVARSVAVDMITKDDGIRTEIQKMIAEATAKVIGADREKIVGKIADAIEKGILEPY